MATFTPPTVQDVPNMEYEYTALSPSDGSDVTKLGKALFSRYRNETRSKTVYLLKDGTVTEETPQTTYTSDGVVLQEASSRVARVFMGPTETVNATEAAALVAAGYTVV